MSDLKGFYVIRKDVNDVKQEISQIISSYKIRAGINEEKIAIKRYCELTLRLLESSFEQGMCGVEKCKRLLKPYKDSDDINQLRIAKCKSDEILLELGAMTCNVIPLKDLPTCRPILNCYKDVAVECVKDLTNSKFEKIGLGLVSLLLKGKDAVTVVDVWDFYTSIINELEREMREESWVLCPIEQELLYKSKAERGYCYKAMVKTGFGIVHELKGIIDEATADEDIRRFEEREHNNNSISRQSNLNNGFCHKQKELGY